VLRIFSPLKIRRLWSGLNPRTWVLKASTLPLDHRSRFEVFIFEHNFFHLNSRTTHKTSGIRNWVNPGYSIKGISCYMHVSPPVRVWASAMYFSIRGVEEVHWPASSVPVADHPILHGSQHTAKCPIWSVLRLLSSALTIT
jgi:hypothetical protein